MSRCKGSNLICKAFNFVWSFLLKKVSVLNFYVVFLGHSANVFTTCFTSDSKFLLSGGNDGLILKFPTQDYFPISMSASSGRCNACEIFNDHQASVLKIDIHPNDDEIMLSARYKSNFLL